MIIIIHLMFWNTKLARITILELLETLFIREGEWLFAAGYDVPNNSWDYADIALTTFCRSKNK
jgi:hypothetical protein